MSAVRSKTERIHQLRRHYQQTHRERQGRYLDDTHEDLEQVSTPQVRLSLLPAASPVILVHTMYQYQILTSSPSVTLLNYMQQWQCIHKIHMDIVEYEKLIFSAEMLHFVNAEVLNCHCRDLEWSLTLTRVTHFFNFSKCLTSFDVLFKRGRQPDSGKLWRMEYSTKTVQYLLASDSLSATASLLVSTSELVWC